MFNRRDLITKSSEWTIYSSCTVKWIVGSLSSLDLDQFGRKWWMYWRNPSRGALRGEGLHYGCEMEGKEMLQCEADGCIVSAMDNLAIIILRRNHGEVELTLMEHFR